ncbi:nucleotidyltransferase family protein [Enterocloster citroniae]|nr:nucleotidyltransferase family protein [Enterocloster citroniae]
MSREKHSEEENQDIKERYGKVNQKKLFVVCREHELHGVTGAYAKSMGLPIPDEWEKAFLLEKRRLDFLKNTAIQVCQLMSDHGIPMVILKNGGIMMDMIPETVKCPMEDIDSLIRKTDFCQAHKLLIENGFTFKFRSEYEAEKLEEAYRDGSAEYFITMPTGEKIWFELAWRAVAGRWIRPDLEPDTNGFIGRSHTVGDTQVRVLSPEDNLLQVCIHTAKHSYVRAPGMRLHMDVDRIVAHTDIDWELFLKKVKEAHVCTSTYLSLYIPSVILHTQIPQWVLDELRPQNIKKLMRLLSEAELPHPQGKKFSKMKFLLFQTALYDNKSDIMQVIFPDRQWMEERYNCNSVIQLMTCTVIRVLDLIGMRKKKR